MTTGTCGSAAAVDAVAASSAFFASSSSSASSASPRLSTAIARNTFSKMSAYSTVKDCTAVHCDTTGHYTGIVDLRALENWLTFSLV